MYQKKVKQMLRVRFLLIITTCCLLFATTTFIPASEAHAASAKPASPNFLNGRIVNYATNQHCLGVTGGSTQEGAQTIIWSCNSNPDQHWTAVPDTQHQRPGYNTFYNLVNGNGLCLGVPGGSLNWGVTPIQWACNGNLDQDWELSYFAGSFFFLLNMNNLINGNQDVCLGVAGGNVYTGATPVMWGCDSSTNQTWHFG